MNSPPHLQNPQNPSMTSALEILDGLPVVPPSSLRADSRICTICWKAYADSPAEVSLESGDEGDSESETARRLPCGHVFGYSCLHEWIVEEGATSCPMCRTVIVGLEGYPGYQGGDEEGSGDGRDDDQGESGRRSEDEEEESGGELGYDSPRPQYPPDHGTMFPFTSVTPLGTPTQYWAAVNQEVSDQELLSGEDEDEDMGGVDGDDEMQDYEGDDEGDEDGADEEEEEADEDLETNTSFSLTSQPSGASATSQKTITELQSPLSPSFQPVSDEELLGEEREDEHGDDDELLDRQLEDYDEDGYDEEGDEDMTC